MRSTRRIAFISPLVALLIAACSDVPTAPKSGVRIPDAPSNAVAPGTVVNVSNVTDLYAKVNDANYAGAVLLLATGTYPLDPTKQNSGRLELQPGMSLRGQVGTVSAVIIDATALTVGAYLPTAATPPTPTTGTIRMGRGTQTVEWLTVRGSQGVAAIETDLSSTSAPNVTISHVEISASRRGIDIRNNGSASAGRVLTAAVRDSYLHGQNGNNGQGIRILNSDQANGAQIVATLERNVLDTNRVGTFAGNNGVVGSIISVYSTDDAFKNGGVGFGAVGGVGNTSSSTVSVSMLRPSFIKNIGLLPAGFAVNAGLSVEGGSTANVTESANSNTASVNVITPTFSGNAPSPNACGTGTALPNADVRAWGVRSTSGQRAGVFNTGSVSISGAGGPLKTCKLVSDPAEPGSPNIVQLAVS